MAVGKAWMADENTLDDDRAGVAVVSYRLPRLHAPAEVLANAHKIRQMVEGLKLGLPGMDLVVFPPHSTDGITADAGKRGTPDQVLQVLALACRNARVWGVFSMATPEAAMILLDDRGELVHTWWQGTAGALATGPRGLALTLILEPADNAAASACWQEAARLGAELVVHCQTGIGIDSLSTLASAHHTFVATARGSDTAVPSNGGPGGRSAIIGFDGQVLAEGGDQAYSVRHVEFSRQAQREARSQATPQASALTSATRDPRSRPAAPPRGAAAPWGRP